MTKVNLEQTLHQVGDGSIDFLMAQRTIARSAHTSRHCAQRLAMMEGNRAPIGGWRTDSGSAWQCRANAPCFICWGRRKCATCEQSRPLSALVGGLGSIRVRRCPWHAHAHGDVVGWRHGHLQHRVAEGHGHLRRLPIYAGQHDRRHATTNNVSFTVTATASDPAEDGEAAAQRRRGIACGLRQTAGNSFTCTVGQLKAGRSLPTFQAFLQERRPKWSTGSSTTTTQTSPPTTTTSTSRLHGCMRSEADDPKPQPELQRINDEFICVAWHREPDQRQVGCTEERRVAVHRSKDGIPDAMTTSRRCWPLCRR